MSAAPSLKIIPMVDIPESAFPGLTPRDKKLRELRALPRQEGLFMVRQADDEEFAASFDLQGAHFGKWVLGKFSETIVERRQPGTTTMLFSYRHTAYLYFGTITMEEYCPTVRDVADVIELLDVMGVSESVTTRGSNWDICLEDNPFDSYKLPDPPYDLLISMLTMGNAQGVPGDEY